MAYPCCVVWSDGGPGGNCYFLFVDKDSSHASGVDMVFGSPDRFPVCCYPFIRSVAARDHRAK